MTNKNLLPDNVNNAEEYLEYLNAIGHFEYVQKLREFKEKILNDLPSDEAIEKEFTLEIGGNKRIYSHKIVGAKWMRDKIQGGNNEQR